MVKWIKRPQKAIALQFDALHCCCRLGLAQQTYIDDLLWSTTLLAIDRDMLWGLGCWVRVAGESLLTSCLVEEPGQRNVWRTL